MHPAGLEAHPEERVLRPELLDLEQRDAFPRCVRVERDSGRVVTVTADRRLDAAAARALPSAHECQVRPLEPPFADELREAPMGFLRTGQGDQAGGVAVEPVHDTGPLGVAACDAARQRIDERAALMT